MSEPGLLLVGRINRAHGLKGEVIVDLTSNRLERTAPGTRFETDRGPLENMARWLEIAGHPKQALISIGATRYTDFGETHFLEAGDESIVAVYDTRRFSNADIRRIAMGERETTAEGLSLLRQTVC